MNKQYYRELLNELKPVVKISKCALDVGIGKSNLSYFLKGEAYDHMISLSKLELLVAHIKSSLSSL